MYLTWYFDGAGGTAQQAMNACQVYVTAMRAVQNVAMNVTFDSQVLLVDSVTGDIVSAVSVTPGAGASGQVNGNPAPLMVQGLVELFTGLYVAGRQVRGRQNIPVMAASLIGTGGYFTGATTAQVAANGLVADANSTWCVWSRKNGISVPITTAIVQNKFATLRTRNV